MRRTASVSSLDLSARTTTYRGERHDATNVPVVTVPRRAVARKHAPSACAAALDGPIERIVVFRALMLGDLLCAVPALRALRSAFPNARLTLIGLPWAAALVERLSCVDDFIAFPGHPGLPERACDVRAIPTFLEVVQGRRFDLAIQLHGSGPIVNPLVAAFGARHSAGFCNDEAWRPDDDAPFYAPWPKRGHEILRLLALTDWLGLPRVGTGLEFPVQPADREALRAIFPPSAHPGSYTIVHAGAQLPSRRWPVERFAEVASRLAERGETVVLTGTADEAELVAALSAAIPYAVVNLAGRTTLWMLGALVENAAQIVCNDTGLSHIAAALGTPSVVVSSGSDVERWGPLDRNRHCVLWQPMSCRPCSHVTCPIGHGCALAISAAEVMQAVSEGARGPIARPSSPAMPTSAASAEPAPATIP